jgi:hypothetical protein
VLAVLFFNKSLYNLKSLCIQEHKTLDPYKVINWAMAPKDLAGTLQGLCRDLAGTLDSQKKLQHFCSNVFLQGCF